MNRNIANRVTVLLSLLTVSYCLGDYASAATNTPLFASPARPTASNEVLLISTRRIGTVCERKSMNRGLHCQRLIANPAESTAWKTAAWRAIDWRQLISQQDNRPTIIYIHGNRVDPGQDRFEGLSVYRSLVAHRQANGPIRFIIWSWPSEKIPGPIKDYLVKAKRTDPAAWQLAWLLDKLPQDAQLSLVGYSYGTRVITGATQLLAGGRLGRLRLAARTHPQRPPVRAALMAAAFDADWIQPGNYYGRSLTQFERLVLGTNARDPAMRFYHLSNGRGHMDALGKSGVYHPRSLGGASKRLRHIDFTQEVGRSHSIYDYLAADAKMSKLWYELTHVDNQSFAASATPRAVARLKSECL